MSDPSQFNARSDSGKAFLAKIWMPFVIVCGIVLLFGSDWRGLLFVSPLIIFSAFLFSLARVRVQAQGLSFRRFLKWRFIPDNEIKGSGIAWPPVIGFLELSRFVFPWGKLYFILDGSLFDVSVRPQEYELLTYLRNRATREASPARQVNLAAWSVPKLLVVGTAGALLSVVNIAFFSDFPQFHPIGSDWPHWLLKYDQAQTSLMHPPWNFLMFVAFLTALIFNRDRKRAWIFAFMAGLMVPFLIRNLR